MAIVIPSDTVIPAGRILIQQDEEYDCIGTIVKIGDDSNWGCFPRAFRFTVEDDTKLTRKTFDPDFVYDPENPGAVPDTITVDYTQIVFNNSTALEVQIDDKDYYLIHVNDILGLIPPE